MFPFKKKKEEEEEEKDILDEDLPAKKKFRDLKPENKKKRKEPVKPWGKSERILILIVLGLTVGISVLLGAISRGGLSLPKISFNQPSAGSPFSLGSVLGETFTFDSGKQNSCCTKAVDDFKNLTDDLSGEYGFYVIRPSDGRSYGFNENESFKAASLIKIPTAITLYKEAEDGQINLDDKYTLQQGDKSGGNGSLAMYSAGTVFTYRQLTEYMLNQSDNTAFNILESVLSDRKIQDVVIGLNTNNTSIYDNLTSAKDIANIILKLKNAEILNRRDSDEILSYMEGTSFNSWIVAGVPGNIRVAHKFGDDDGIINDAGIIYTKDPYILVIVSRDVDEGEANTVFPQISKAVYSFESGQ